MQESKEKQSSLKELNAEVQQCKVQIKALEAGMLGMLPPNLLSDLERFQGIAHKYTSQMETIQKSRDERLRRLVSLEADMKQVQGTTKYL